MWQLFVAGYFVFGTANYVLRRELAQKIGEQNRLINAVFFLFFLLPVGAVLVFFFPHNLNVGSTNLILLLAGSIVWPLYYLVAFSANKHVDVGIFSVINNLSPIVTLAIALPFLHENPSTLQLVGIGLLIFSGALAASSKLRQKSGSTWQGIWLCLLTALILGFATAYEKFMLNRIDFGAYLVYGWGAQIVWSTIIAWSDLKKIPAMFSKTSATRSILIIWGVSSALRSCSFILALKVTSASILSATTDFLSILVVLVAYFYLKEREHMLIKWSAAAIGVLGLLLVAA
ncbi:MAG TPA: DMT family transporter [Candidatus Paceibacterota bacterium]|jgi:drug/metabolite transporter (DMT)-like permease|nr:DMT family transporter [Candidatus Paceibacterota bacterium]